MFRTTSVRILLFMLLLLLLASVVKSQNSTADSLENLLKQSAREDTVKVNILLKLANEFCFINSDKSLIYSEAAIKLSNKLNHKKGLAEGYNLIGIYYYLKGNDSLSLTYYKKSLKIDLELGNKLNIGLSYANIGTIYANQGNYSMALDSYKKSLKINEEIGDKGKLANIYNNIGVIYYELKDYDKALEYYEKNIILNEVDTQSVNTFDQKRSISNTYNNIALIYERQNKLDKALTYYDKSEKIALEIDYSYLCGWIYNGKGIVYEKQKDFDKAHEFYFKGLEFRENIKNLLGISQSCNNIGKLYLKEGDFQESKKYLLRAFKIAKETGSPLYQKDAAEGLSSIYERLGQYKKSIEYYKIFKQMSDSLINEGNIKKLAAYEINTKHEKEIQAIELEQQKKDAIREEKNKKQTIITHSSLLGFALMVFIVFLILRGYKQKQKSNKLLSLQYQKIEDKNNQLHEQNEEIQQLNEELRSANEALYMQKEELEKHRNNLENIVKERTADLIIAKEKAEESDRLKSAFLANMSHEIRTPMNAIIGFTDLLSDPELSDETKEELSFQINHNSDTLLNLIDDIIDIAMIESGQLKIRKKQSSVNEILERLIPIYKNKLTALNKNQVEFVIQIPEEKIILNTDPQRLQQILVNLIDNAIKFTEKGEVEIGIHHEDQQNDIIFFVKDTGIGLTNKQKEIIFRRFTKVENDRKKLYRGAGLGLAISKNLVELLGGKIWVKSEENKGSTFYFGIPLS